MEFWQLQEAKARLSQLVKNCHQSGPQGISVRGVEEAVVLAIEDYKKLIGKKETFLEFMNKSPLKGLSLKLKRDSTKPRKIDL